MIEKKNEMILEEEGQYVKPVMEIIDIRNDAILTSGCYGCDYGCDTANAEEGGCTGFCDDYVVP